MDTRFITLISQILYTDHRSILIVLLIIMYPPPLQHGLDRITSGLVNMRSGLLLVSASLIAAAFPNNTDDPYANHLCSDNGHVRSTYQPLPYISCEVMSSVCRVGNR